MALRGTGSGCAQNMPHKNCGHSLLKHPENQDRYGDEYALRRHGNSIEIDASFDKMGREIFTMPTEMMAVDYDHPFLVGGDILSTMVESALRDAKLQEGKDVRTHIQPHEKGHLTIRITIQDDP